MPDQLQTIVQRMIDAGESEDNIATVIQHFKTAAPLPTRPVSAEDFRKPTGFEDAISTAKDVVKGGVKGALHSGIDLAEKASQSGMIPGLSIAPQLTDRAKEKTAYTNTAQQVGGGLETAAELALPMRGVLRAIPSASRAAGKFQSVMSAAKDVPIDTSAPGNVALRIQELADRGGTMPTAVRKLIGRMTDPTKAPIAYGESRDFASNISRLSNDEFNRLTPVIRNQVGELRSTLNAANEAAAGKVGKAQDYTDAMTEYARAMKMKDLGSSVAGGVKKGLPYATGAGAGYWMMKKLLAALGQGGSE